MHFMCSLRFGELAFFLVCYISHPGQTVCRHICSAYVWYLFNCFSDVYCTRIFLFDSNNIEWHHKSKKLIEQYFNTLWNALYSHFKGQKLPWDQTWILTGVWSIFHTERGRTKKRQSTLRTRLQLSRKRYFHSNLAISKNWKKL